MSNWLRKRKTGLLVLLLGCAFVVLGIYRGEQDTVLRKAALICMECIGIG